jgi:toxin-antitoxin system PIN domain toxin
MLWLLDGNVLIALADDKHVHHQQARRWFAQTPFPFATCPITQGALLRILLATRSVADAKAASEILARLTAHARHHFLADDITYRDVSWKGVIGHRQVTDAYLAALARHHGAKLATLDRGLAALHADVAVLIGA